jgi:hypothetical protein
VITRLLWWASEGKISIHREISLEEVELHETIYKAGLVEVQKAKWNGKDAAVKMFLYEGFDWTDFYKELSLQW